MAHSSTESSFPWLSRRGGSDETAAEISWLLLLLVLKRRVVVVVVSGEQAVVRVVVAVMTLLGDNKSSPVVAIGADANSKEPTAGRKMDWNIF